MLEQNIIVLKFGSSVLRNASHLGEAVLEIERWRGEGLAVVAVVSAFEGETDRLLELGHGHGPVPEPFALAALAACGEALTAAQLGLALGRAGVPALVLDPGALGFRATGNPLDAVPLGLDSASLRRALRNRTAVITSGFVARCENGATVLLGRGGSDLSALFIAYELGRVRCRLLKDVDGLYDRDPALFEGARRFQSASYKDVLALDEGIIQHKGVHFAAAVGLPFEVAALGSNEGTAIGTGPTKLYPAEQGNFYDTADFPCDANLALV